MTGDGASDIKKELEREDLREKTNVTYKALTRVDARCSPPRESR